MIEECPKMLETYNSLRKLAIGNESLYQLTDEDIRAIQKCLLEMMEDIDSVCEKYHLEYAITGGAMLGAVRHKGFIPWDDDIDICMPRHDYNRFYMLFMREFSDKYHLQYIEKDPKYDLNFMKVRMKNTVYLEVFDMDEEKAGIFIDIFPAENTFSNPILRVMQGLLSDGMLLLSSCVRMATKEKRLLKYTKDSEVEKSVRIKVLIGKILTCFCDSTWWYLLTERALSLCKDNESEYISVPCGRKHFFGEFYKRSTFYPSVRRKFETEEFKCVRDPDAYLTNMYGDYMKIPPESERERHSVLRFLLSEQ